MRTIDFMRKKNEILIKECGMVLVPEEQLIDIDCTSEMSTKTDATMCPYCVEFFLKADKDCYNACEGCPMDNAGNACNEGRSSSTYQSILSELKSKNNTDLYLNNLPGLLTLVDEWNSSLGAKT